MSSKVVSVVQRWTPIDSQAPRRADDGLRCRSPGQRDLPSAGRGHRLRADVPARRPGHGQQGPLRAVSQRLLAQLRHYWCHQRPRSWLFPSRYGDRPMSRDGAAFVYRSAKRKAGITKSGGIHTITRFDPIRLVERNIFKTRQELVRKACSQGSGHGRERARASCGIAATDTTACSPRPAPATGTAVGHDCAKTETEEMNRHLREIGERVPTGMHALIVHDGVGTGPGN